MTERKRSHFSCNSFRFRAVQKIKKWGKCRHKSLIIITPLLDRLQKRESYRANKRFYPVLTNLGDPGNIFYPTWGTYIHNKQFSKCQNVKILYIELLKEKLYLHSHAFEMTIIQSRPVINQQFHLDFRSTEKSLLLITNLDRVLISLVNLIWKFPISFQIFKFSRMNLQSSGWFQFSLSQRNYCH